jgi:predicted  nucleic acid-binding Zn ribbon protein
MNGQVCGCEWPITISGDVCRASVFIPEPSALDPRWDATYVRRAITELAAAGLARPECIVLGPDIASSGACACARPSSSILYTTYRSIEPPLCCGDCFRSIPLYRLPPTYDQEYSDVISWASDYQACDSLQMGCATLERAALRELSRHDSSLSRRGRAVAEQITRQTAVPTYTYLYRGSGRSRAQERRRRCPSCDGAWALAEPWHIFDFRCDRCRLVSNIAWNVR